MWKEETCVNLTPKKKKMSFVKEKLYGQYLWTEFNRLKGTEPLRGGSLLFTTKFQEISGTHLVDLERMKG